MKYQENMFLNEKQVADILGVSLQFLRRRRAVGDGPPVYKLGSLCRYPSAELDEWVSQQRKSGFAKEAGA